VVFVILETITPTAAWFLWMGIASGIVGVVLLIIPTTPWQVQIVLFAVFSIASILAYMAYLKRNPIATDEPRLNRRGEQYVGRVFTLTEPVVNGSGKIRVDDSTWKIIGDDCPAGSKVRVVAADGVLLKIESA